MEPEPSFHSVLQVYTGTDTYHYNFALFIIFLGTLFLVDNLNIVDIHIPYYFTQWYTFLIVLGLFLLFVREKTGPAIVLLVIGGLFFISDVSYLRVWSLWPLLLIAAGVAILLRRRSAPEAPSASGENPMDVIDEVAIFSGSERIIHSKNFRGGKISAVFGGAEIDLSKAELAEGDNVIDLFVMFGGGTIYVHPEMNVHVNVTSIFGGYSDERGLVNPDDSDRKLIITGTVLFGGGELKVRARS